MKCPKCNRPASVVGQQTFSDPPKGGVHRYHCFADLSCGCTVKEVLTYSDDRGWE